MEPRKYRKFSLGGTLALLILIAVVIGGIWFLISGGTSQISGGGRDLTENIPASGIRSIRVDYPRGSVKVVTAAGNEVTIQELQLTEGQPLTHSLENGTLVIQGGKSEKWWDFLLRNNNARLVLELPGALISDLEFLEIRTDFGEISTDAVIADRILLETSQGDIGDVTLEGTEIKLHTSSGSIRDITLGGGSVALSSNSGTVRDTVASAEEASIETSSGEIRNVRVTADRADLKSSSGNIRNSSFDVNETLILTTGSGNIRDLELSSEKAELTTSSGNIETSLDTAFCVLKANSGNIDVNFTDRLNFAGMQTSSGNIDVHAPFDVDIRADLDTLEEGAPDPARKTIAVASGSGRIHINEIDVNEMLDR